MPPRPAAICGTRAPTAKNLVATAIPIWPVAVSRAMIDQVISAYFMVKRSCVVAAAELLTLPWRGRVGEHRATMRDGVGWSFFVGSITPPRSLISFAIDPPPPGEGKQFRCRDDATSFHHEISRDDLVDHRPRYCHRPDRDCSRDQVLCRRCARAAYRGGPRRHRNAGAGQSLLRHRRHQDVARRRESAGDREQADLGR